MPTASMEDIEDEAHHQIWRLGNFDGGYMFKAYQQPGSINMSEEQFECQYQSVLKYANYPLQPYTTKS